MTETDFDSLAGELNDSSGTDTSNDGSSDDSDFENEYDDAPILNVTPQVAVEYDDILDIGLMGGIKADQNIRTSGEGGNDLVITLLNPSAAEGSLFAADEDQAGPDYRLVDMDHDRVSSNAEKNDGGEFEEVGITQYGWDYDSEEVDDFQEDVIRLMIDSVCGQRLAQLLDVRGGESAYYEGEDKNTGLIEYPPEYGNDEWNPRENDSDRYPRIARTPTLRDDVTDESGLLFFYMDGQMHKVDVFVGEPTLENKLEIQNEGVEPEWPPYLVWDEPSEDDENDADSSDSTSDDDDGNSTPANLEAITGGDNDAEEDTELTYDDLGELDSTFVDTAVDEGLTVEEHNLDETYETFVADNDYDGTATDTIVNIVEERQ